VSALFGPTSSISAVQYFDQIREGEADDASDLQDNDAANLLSGGSFAKISSHAGKQISMLCRSWDDP
jgi:hypothetical protein